MNIKLPSHARPAGCISYPSLALSTTSSYPAQGSISIHLFRPAHSFSLHNPPHFHSCRAVSSAVRCGAVQHSPILSQGLEIRNLETRNYYLNRGTPKSENYVVSSHGVCTYNIYVCLLVRWMAPGMNRFFFKFFFSFSAHAKCPRWR